MQYFLTSQGPPSFPEIFHLNMQFQYSFHEFLSNDNAISKIKLCGYSNWGSASKSIAVTIKCKDLI